jgi:hypothetical protein
VNLLPLLFGPRDRGGAGRGRRRAQLAHRRRHRRAKHRDGRRPPRLHRRRRAQPPEGAHTPHAGAHGDPGPGRPPGDVLRVLTGPVTGIPATAALPHLISAKTNRRRAEQLPRILHQEPLAHQSEFWRIATRVAETKIRAWGRYLQLPAHRTILPRSSRVRLWQIAH